MRILYLQECIMNQPKKNTDTRLASRPSNDMLKLEINRKLFPEGFFRWPIHLHHDHTSGMTIGAVHNTCNAVLWQYHGE
jgi:hypothetical protein